MVPRSPKLRPLRRRTPWAAVPACLMLAVGAGPLEAAEPPATQELLVQYARAHASGLGDDRIWPLEDLLARQAKAPSSLAKVQRALAAAWGIPEAAASALLRGFLLGEASQEAPKASLQDAARTLYEQALALAPDSRMVRNYVLRFYGSSAEEDGRQLEGLRRTVASSPRPTETALDLADYDGGEAGLRALAAAQAEKPDHPLVLLKASHLARRASDPALAAVLAEAADRTVRDRRDPPPFLRAQVATAWLEALMDLGLSRRAVQVWHGLPEPVRRQVIGEARWRNTGEGDGDSCALEPVGEAPTLLALALQLEGFADEAGTLLRAAEAPWPQDQVLAPEEAGARTLQIRLLEQWRTPAGPDPFDLVVELLGDRQGWTSEGGWNRLLEAWGAREGYAEALDSGRPAPPTGAASTREGDLESPWPSAWKGRMDELRSDAARVGSDSRSTPGRKEAPAGDSQVRLLARPRQVPFRERPLPAGLAPAPQAGEEPSAALEQRVKALHFPGFFDPVRAESRGREAVVLGVSQDLDPVGEVSRGGYWVARTHDAGRTWDPPRYTGLQVYRPYLVKASSSLAMMAGDHLHVEVAVRELDEASITFPPVGLRVKRAREGIYLDFPWSELEKDQDGDGLTDLVEERLLTDPEVRDTDGDGLPDGEDALPQVAAAPSDGSPEATALAAVLARICLQEPPAIITGLRPPKESLEAYLRAMVRGSARTLHSSRRAIFLCADRRRFRSLAPAERLVVVTPEERDLIRRKFGTFYPLELPVFCFNRDRTQAFCRWDASWTGGSFRLRRQGKGWKVTPVSSWIS